MHTYFPWHTETIESVAHELNTDPEQGLSNKEANSRLLSYKANETFEQIKTPWSNIFLRQQASLMIPIFLITIIYMFYLWYSSNESHYLMNGFVIAGVLIVNIILSSAIETKSEKHYQFIRKVARNSTFTKVLRNGHINLVKTTDVVPGDVICFEIGDRITADGRLIYAKDLTIDESAIFGTIGSAHKDPNTLNENFPIHQRNNMVFKGSLVTSGSGKAIVTATGKQTQIANVRKSKEIPDRSSAVEREISNKGIVLFVLSVVISILIGLGMIFLGMKWQEGIILSLSFFMSAWPIGMLESVALTLTVGIKRLNDMNVIVRRFSKAEKLADITTLCSNKKGIMTENRMTVKKIFVDGHIIDIDEESNNPEWDGFSVSVEEENPDLPLLLTIASLSTNARIKKTTEGWSIDGDTAEGELVIAAEKGGINKEELELSLTKIKELPYDAERKRITTIYKDIEGEIFVFTRGNLETILDVCSNMQLHGFVDDLDISRLRAIWAVSYSFAKDFTQSIGLAYRKLKSEPETYTVENIERDLIFVGLMGLVDPPRADTKKAIEDCLSGSIKPILFTEDSEDTAFSFAQNIGIAKSESEVLTGEDLDTIGEGKFSDIYNRFSVYANISPPHKVRVIRAMKENKEITAMIGDSIYDAPAIREANIGFSRGKIPASITIDSADIVLMDDSFASSVNAIRSARITQNNIRKVIRYFLSGSLAISFAFLLGLVIGTFWKDVKIQPLSLIHILWFNTIAVAIPAIAIIFRSVSGDMSEDMYLRGSVFSNEIKGNILIRGLLTGIFAVIAYIFSFGPAESWDTNQEHARTAVLTILVMSQLAFAFQCSASRTGFFSKFVSSKLMVFLFIIVLLMHLLIIYIPFINTIFGTKPLSLIDWIPIVVAFLILSLPLDEIFTTRVEYEEEVSPESEYKEDLANETEISNETSADDANN